MKTGGSPKETTNFDRYPQDAAIRLDLKGFHGIKRDFMMAKVVNMTPVTWVVEENLKFAGETKKHHWALGTTFWVKLGNHG